MLKKGFITEQKIPFWYVMYPDIQQNKQFKESILKIREENPQNHDLMKQNTGWHSSYRLHLETPYFKDLCNFTTGACSFISESHYGHTPPEPYMVYNMWAMMYEKGNRTAEHDHFPSVFAAVYFVDCEEGSAPLKFYGKSIVPKNGALVIFPGIVRHEVLPTETNRIVLSMNLEVDRDGVNRMLRK